jgi:hypothetical protein
MAAQKPLLTLKMNKRLACAKQYRHFTEEDWITVMYSDDSTFCCARSIRSRVRRLTGADWFDSQYTMKTVEHPASLMLWACFSGSYGHGCILFTT